MSRPVYDAILVGCGASGLAALSTLSRAGLKVLGLEADVRIGGRVNTVPFGGGVVEMGAEWIHGETNNRVFELARKHNLPISKDVLEFEFRRSDGSKPPVELCDELLAYCWAVKEGTSFRQKLGDYVSSQYYAYIKEHPTQQMDDDFYREFLTFVHLLSNNYDATNDWNDISTIGSQAYEELDGHMHWSFGQNGYRTLLQSLIAGSSPEVQLNREVEEIDWSPGHSGSVAVSCKDGASFEAQAVIVTVSLGVLKERHSKLFVPPLPPSKVEAIESMSMGVMDKIQLLYDRPWWPDSRKFFGFVWKGEDRRRLERDRAWVGQIFGFSVPSGCENGITLWTSGDNAKIVELLPEEEVKRGCKELLQRFMGPSVEVPDPVDMLRSTWYSNPRTRGSYSYHGLATDDKPHVWRDLRQPLCDSTGRARVLFAGEACSQHYFSTVHGAIDTGISAAETLLNATTRRQKSKI